MWCPIPPCGAEFIRVTPNSSVWRPIPPKSRAITLQSRPLMTNADPGIETRSGTFIASGQAARPPMHGSAPVSGTSPRGGSLHQSASRRGSASSAIYVVCVKCALIIVSWGPPVRPAQSSRHAVYYVRRRYVLLTPVTQGCANKMANDERFIRNAPLKFQRGDVYKYVILFAIIFFLCKLPDIYIVM